MKRVFSKFEDVARVWAARSQQDGRSGNGSFFFEGNVAYSYRWSFPVAAMFDAPDGRTFCLVETDSPSTSTAVVRGLAAAAAGQAGCEMLHLPSIAPIVETFSRPPRKIDAKALNAIRTSIELEVADLAAAAERSADNSWAQHSRLSRTAQLLRTHQDLAVSFGLDWPSPASPEAYEARAEMAYEVSQKISGDKRRELEKSRKAAQRRRDWEKKHPLPPEQELAQWRTGERLTLQHQPAEHPHAIRTVRARIVDGKFLTDKGWSRPLKDFSRLLSAAVAVAADRDDAETRIRIGGDSLQIHGNGDIALGWQTVLDFDELMTCAEIGAPRLHAKAVAAMAEAAEQDEMAP